VYILNLDVGGGTTNLALGRGGDVIRTGCLFAGARHFQFVPGSHRIIAMSSYAGRLLRDLGIDGTIGDSLSPEEHSRILDFYVALIETAVLGDRSRLDRDPFRYHEQVSFELPPDAASPVITFSGGVGELIYKQIRGEPPPATTEFGDLGIDLAQRLIQSSVLSRHLRTHTPMNCGHATVYGLSLHGTEVSGATLYLPQPGALPLRDLPIVAKLRLDAPADDVQRAVDLAGRGTRGGCIGIAEGAADFAAVKTLGNNLASALRRAAFPGDRSLVLFVPHNVGKTLGSYATDWGRMPVNLIVVDELTTRNARFASLGAMRDNVVPVSFYGMQ
jgi:ethanolamine utilization protein EutA